MRSILTLFLLILQLTSAFPITNDPGIENALEKPFKRGLNKRVGPPNVPGAPVKNKEDPYTEEEFQTYLDALETRMLQQGWPAEKTIILFVVGGATMVFDLHTRKTTHDIDFIWDGQTDKLNKLKEEIEWVAEKLNIRKDWMNDKATTLLVSSERKQVFKEAMEEPPIMESKPKRLIRLLSLPLDYQFAMKFDAVARTKLTEEEGGGSTLKPLDLTDAVELLHKLNEWNRQVSSVAYITRLAKIFHQTFAKYTPEAAVAATWEFINTEYKSYPKFKGAGDGIVQREGSHTPGHTSDTSVD